jgi:hypothetical protein
MYVKRLFPILFFLLPISLLSQTKDRGAAAAEKAQKKQEKKEKINQLIKQEEEGALIYQKQHAYGFNFHTDGWSFFYEKGKYKTITKTGLWWVSFGERKHPKEERIPTVSSSGGLLIVSSYTYGKVNNFYSLNVGIGEQRLIGGKGNKNGVAVSLIYGGALAAGLLRPYYLEVINPSTGARDQIRYTTTNKSLFLDASGIIGKGGLTKGWNEVNFVPGFQAKTALRFDYGRYNELLSAIEVGLHASYYTKPMPMLLDVPEKKFFFNAYVSLCFGKRK